MVLLGVKCTKASKRSGLIITAKMNGVDPQAWLTEVLARIAEHPAKPHRKYQTLMR
jgi:hypothetical protein